MLTTEQVTGLKKVNASIDAAKTTERVVSDFKASSKAEKDKMYNLSGLGANSYYNVSKTGAASPRVILSMAQVLNVTPFYYSGEADEKNPCSKKLLNNFYSRYTDKKVKPNKNLKSKETEAGTPFKAELLAIPDKKIPENKIKQNEKAAAIVGIEFDYSDKMNTVVSNLKPDDAALLLNALFKRAEAGGKAETLCDFVKRCLLA